MNKLLFRSCATAAALTAIAALGQEARFDHKVREDFFAGLMGNQEALSRAMDACEKVLKTNPNNGEALVWHGAGLFANSGRLFQTGGENNRAMQLYVQGLTEMERAVSLEPDNLAVRIPRGATLLAASRDIPDVAQARSLLEKGLSDYEKVYAMQQAELATMGTHPKGELLFGMAEGYARKGDIEKASTFFERIRAEMPKTVYAKRAEMWLSTKSLPRSETQCVGCHTK